jgi:hypothetical protein
MMLGTCPTRRKTRRDERGPSRSLPTFILSLAQLLCGAPACRAQPAHSLGPFSPAETRSLKSFGAVGDGRVDDTAALGRALANSERYCLDGGGQAYRVTGTLRVATDLCLRNLTLVQSAVPVDTRPYIVGGCPAIQDPSAVVDCKDPPVPREKLAGLWASLSIRTLLIRSGDDHPFRVNLSRVKIDRGPYAEQGSRSDSAGIWVDGASRVDFRDVEITGNGKGYGLQITNARNVTLTNLWVHDLVWAPYPGDRVLSEAAVRSGGWNSVPIHEFREQRPGQANPAKFYGVRIQEQLTCVSLANVSHVRIDNLRVERCMARFNSGNLPWQADGLDIGRSSSDVAVAGARIDSTWEGVDVAAGGDGIDGLRIDNLAVSNSFSFGLKMGYRLRDARISGLSVDGAGLSGVVIYGPVRDLRLSRASIQNVGIVQAGGGRYSPWPAGNRAGLRIDGGANSSPEDLVVADMTVSGGPSEFEFGVLNTGGRRVHLVGFQARGFGLEKTRGVAESP